MREQTSQFRWEDQFNQFEGMRTDRIFMSRRSGGEEDGEGGCSMKITEDVRKYAAQQGIEESAAIEQGLREKSEEFATTGSEVYIKT